MDDLKKIILKYRKLVPKNIFERDLEIFKIALSKAIVIVGPRRAGKTYFLYSLLKKQKNPVLINFEDNLLVDLTPTDLNNILDFSKELFEKKGLSFFFDEIQTVDGWERLVVSLLNENYSVHVTGSNSRMLSKDIATTLRGKSLPYLMLPFSFSEFLRFKDVHLDANFVYTDKVSNIKKLFKEYLKYGGFPEIVIADSIDLKNKLINNYYDSVLYKDLVDRLSLKNIKLVEITMKYLLNIYANTFSIASFQRYLRSSKIPHSLEDLYTIIKSLSDVFLVSYVKQYDKSFKKSEYSKSKVYLFDTAYIHFLSNEPEDLGRILENMVFIELFRREGNVENKNIFYHKDKKGNECDFLVTKRDKVSEAIQVTYEINESNTEREMKGMLSAMKAFNLKKGLILTYDLEKEIKVDGKKIIVKPVWKWLLGV